jgi:hypothetical protein
LDIPIQVPLDLPPSEVTVEVTTPIGRATARFKTTEVQIGGGEGAKREDVVKHPGQGYGGDEGTLALPTMAPAATSTGKAARSSTSAPVMALSFQLILRVRSTRSTYVA